MPIAVTPSERDLTGTQRRAGLRGSLACAGQLSTSGLKRPGMGTEVASSRPRQLTGEEKRMAEVQEKAQQAAGQAQEKAQQAAGQAEEKAQEATGQAQDEA